MAISLVCASKKLEGAEEIVYKCMHDDEIAKEIFVGKGLTHHKTHENMNICDRLCKNPPCSRILHCFTKTAVKS